MLKSHSFLVERSAKARSSNKVLLPHEIRAINDKRIQGEEEAISIFNLALIERKQFIKTWRGQRWLSSHHIEIEQVAYGFAECILNDDDFISCESLGFDRIEKIQLVFLLLSLTDKHDEEGILARQAMALLKHSKDGGLPPLDAYFGNKTLCRYSDAKNQVNVIYYESLAINPLLSLNEVEMEEGELTEALNSLKNRLFKQLSRLKKIYDLFPAATDYSEMMSYWSAKSFIDELMLCKSKSGLLKTGLFTSTRMAKHSSLTDILTNAKREDRVTRCRVLCIKRGWLQENDKKLILVEDAPKPVKDAWNSLAVLEAKKNPRVDEGRQCLSVKEMKDKIRAYREFDKSLSRQSEDMELYGSQRDEMYSEMGRLLGRSSMIINKLVQEGISYVGLLDVKTISDGDIKEIEDNLILILNSRPNIPEKTASEREIEAVMKMRIEHHALFREVARQHADKMQDLLRLLGENLNYLEGLMSQHKMRL